MIDIDDFANIIVAWGGNGQGIPGINADVDFDGTVGINDLAVIIVNWGPCP